MKKSPSQKRLETLKVFFAYCCETYKNKLENNDELLQQVYNIILNFQDSYSPLKIECADGNQDLTIILMPLRS